MGKFGALYELLVRDGIASVDQFHVAPEAPFEWLILAHTHEYVKSYLRGDIAPTVMRRIGFPWSAELAHRTRVALGGSVLTAELALEYGLACNLAGGTHHAHADHGSGYCVFNDLAVTARVMQAKEKVRRVLIVDLDVHQGDGTAAILAGDTSVFTLSMHCVDNFPFRKQASDLDVELPAGTGDLAYLHSLKHVLPEVLRTFKPDLVLYDAGVDPHYEDLLGKLALTDEGLKLRDRYVLECCREWGCPVACVIGGGYGRDIMQLARRHSIVHQVASEVLQRHPSELQDDTVERGRTYSADTSESVSSERREM
jgi:acetoin utilization deacetylase AcuC-like enzyme